MTSLQRSLGAALVATAAVAAPSAASGATDMAVRLEYQVDPQAGCVGEDELRRMVTDQLGHDPFSPDVDQRVAVTITKTEGGFQGRIVWTEADGRTLGQRVLSSRSRDCREIGANVAFAVVLQLQLVERGALDGGEGDQNTEAPPPPKDGGDAAPTISERPSLPEEGAAGAGGSSIADLRLAVGVGPAVGIGLTPDAAAFGRLFVAAGFRHVSVEIAGDAALPATHRASDGTGVAVNAIGSSAAGCGHVSFASACLLARVGWLRARGTDIAVPKTSWGRFTEVGMRLAATRELGRFMVSVHADGLVMTSNWNVVFSDAVVWHVPRFGGLVGLDLALRFF